MAIVGWIDTDTVIRRVIRITNSYTEDLRSEDDTTLQEKTLDAYYSIISALAKRGFTKAQVDTWAQRGEFQRDIATQQVLIAMGFKRNDGQDWIDELDRLEELKSEDDGGEEISLIDEDGVVLEPAGEPNNLYGMVDIEQVNEDLEITLP